MTAQFSKCQEAELSRMEFFKAVFTKFEGILDLTSTNRYDMWARQSELTIILMRG